MSTVATRPDVYAWPTAIPQPKQSPVIIRWNQAAPRDQRRPVVRKILQEILHQWHCTLPWEETPQGPRHPLYRISISYTARTVWLAIHRSKQLGCDAMEIQPFNELTSVSQLYLGPTTTTEILQSHEPSRLFAHHWTVLESRVKARRTSLQEFPATPNPLAHEASWDTDNGISVTLVWSED
jgi:phosphopantetheinyl transferase